MKSSASPDKVDSRLLVVETKVDKQSSDIENIKDKLAKLIAKLEHSAQTGGRKKSP